MQFELSPIDSTDVEALVREVDTPAMRENPLRLLMFPKHSHGTESEIQWNIDNLKKTLCKQNVHVVKVSEPGGPPVGFAGWILEHFPPKQPVVRETTTQNRDGNWLPDGLDIETWVEVSKRLRAEKIRAFKDLTTVWRLMMISVKPSYQRGGIGSQLMQWGCDKADEQGWDSVTMASPAGLPLYKKFGFEILGKVSTSKGDFTSMIRP